MTTADEPTPDQREPGPPPGEPARSGKRIRTLLIGVVVGGVLFVIAFMLLVSQCGTDDSGGIYGAGPATVVPTGVSAV